MKEQMRRLMQNFAKKDFKKIFRIHWPIIIGIPLIILSGVFLWYAMGQVQKAEKAASLVGQLSVEPADFPQNSYTPEFPVYEPVNKSIPNITKKFDLAEMKVEWLSVYDKKLGDNTDALLKQADPTGEYLRNFMQAFGAASTSSSEFSPYSQGFALYEAGKIVGGTLDGKKLYHMIVPLYSMDMPGTSYSYFLVFLTDDNKLVSVETSKVKEAITDAYGYIQGFINKDFSELLPPKTLRYKDKGVTLLLTGLESESYFTYQPYGNVLGISYPAFYDFSQNSLIEPKVSSEPKSDSMSFVSDEGYKVYYSAGCYHILLPNGARAVYNMRWSVIKSLVSPDPNQGLTIAPFLTNINWNRTENKNEKYVLISSPGYCGQTGQCPLDLSKEDWFKKENLIEIGKTFDGEPVYELSDKNAIGLYEKRSSFYKQLFLNTVPTDGLYSESGDRIGTDSDGKKFEEFLLDQPIFFWQDPLGQYIGFKKAKYQSMAECGKPVIYLYPEKEMNVNVQVEPNGGFTKTEPAYMNGGWNVRATPQSELFNFADKTSYPYLFWEGKAYDMPMPDYGFVMSRDEVKTKMSKILVKLGLNEKEAVDFLEFWQPRLEVKPYVFVTFIPQSEFDKLAPLTVTPKPDKVIRVFMDYAPLDAPVAVRPMSIKTPVRTGFTVVEWGGRLNR